MVSMMLTRCLGVLAEEMKIYWLLRETTVIPGSGGSLAHSKE
jgi:hypothetical protein